MKKITQTFRNRSVLAIILICLVFVSSITALFAQEKKRLDTEFESMITGSLKIHTQSNAAKIDGMIADAERALQTAEAMLRKSGIDENIRERLAQRNATAPDYPTEYLSLEELEEEVLHPDEGEARQRLSRGETVVSMGYDKAAAEHFLSVIMPLPDEGGMPGALYTRLKTSELFPDGSESVIYQYAYSCLITGDGGIVFNTFQPDHRGNLMDDLGAYGLAQAEIDKITPIINSQNTDATTFLRKEEAYFISSAYLEYNDWHLVSVVRGPDVVLRSSTFFKEVMVTSSAAILLTAAAACIIFFQLLFSKKKLAEEQRRNDALTQRLKAMFDQHSALKVVLDAGTREIVDANPALCNYFGVAKEEMLGRGIRDFNLLPAHVLAEQFQKVSSGKALFFAAPHRLKNGETKLLDVYASVIYDGGRQLVYAILVDSTDREQYRNELFREKELLKITLRSIGDGVVTTDNLGVITSMNSVAENLTGWDDGMAVGRAFPEVFVLQNEETGQPVENPIQKVFETGRVVGLANHTELKNRQGVCIPIADSAAPIKSENGQTFGVVMVFRDVRAEKEHNTQIEFLSYHDPLTGLYNRRYIEEIMIRQDVGEHLPVSVIMADVNGLKLTNDVFGHKAGDALLKSVADLMRKCCSENNLIARWGGDEFMILMPGTKLESAEAMIQQMKEAHIEIEGSNLSLSLSLGCACNDGLETDLQTAMQQAEENMYQQKLLDGKSYRNAIISTLLATLYEKSNETESHSKRIEIYCHAIGRELRLSSREMDELSLLALLHDIGKVSIHPNILKKPGALNSTEWDEMKRHPEIGYRIAQATPELAAVADLILSHHERWDGEGYPRRLKREEIPLACRILSVADAFDAMTNDRVYRKAMTVEEAILEVERNAGKQFDPQAAELFVRIIKSENKSET